MSRLPLIHPGLSLLAAGKQRASCSGGQGIRESSPRWFKGAPVSTWECFPVASSTWSKAVSFKGRVADILSCWVDFGFPGSPAHQALLYQRGMRFQINWLGMVFLRPCQIRKEALCWTACCLMSYGKRLVCFFWGCDWLTLCPARNTSCMLIYQPVDTLSLPISGCVAEMK